jgi:phage terminase small subunit
MLSDKQKSFCEFYLAVGTDTYMNGAQSAIKAGYSKDSACQQASRLLTNAKVSEYLKENVQKSFNRGQISRQRTLEAIARIAYNEDGDCTTKEQLDGLEKLARFENLYEKEKKTEAEAKQITVNIVK